MVDGEYVWEEVKENGMAMKRIYRCDICRDEIKDPRDSFGVHFSNNVDFTLGGYGSTDGVHICYRCARQLREHLNNERISEIIGDETASTIDFVA